MITKYIKLWIGSPQGVSPVVRLSQYDTEWQLICTLYDGDTVFPVSEGEVMFLGRRVDGTVVTVDGEVENPNVSIVLPSSVSAVPGELDCEVRVLIEGITSTANFAIDVEASPVYEHATAKDDFDGLNQLINNAMEAAKDAIDAAEIASILPSSPFVIVASAADIPVDTSKGFVWAADSTATYEKGAWYYHDGTGWVKGGTYVDESLLLSGVPADAAIVGRKAERYESIVEPGINLVDQRLFLLNKDWLYDSEQDAYYGKLGSAYYSYANVFSGIVYKPNTQYTISFDCKIAASASTNTGLTAGVGYGSDTSTRVISVPRNKTNWTHYEYTTTAGLSVRILYISLANGGSDIWYIRNLIIREGTSAVYVPYALSAVDNSARDNLEEIYSEATEHWINLFDQRKFLLNYGWQYDELGGDYYGLMGTDYYKSARVFGGGSIDYKPNTQYTISFDCKTDAVGATGVGPAIWAGYGDDAAVVAVSIPRSTTSWTHFEYTSTEGASVRILSIALYGGGGTTDVWHYKNVVIREGVSDIYVPYQLSAIDRNARSLLPLESTGDQTDRAAEIEERLLSYGHCDLGAGDFYVTTIEMPEGTILRGQGDATKIYYIDDFGSVIHMGSRCSVNDLSLIGSTEYTSRMDLDGDVVGVFEENLEATNVWENGSVEISAETGYRHIILATPIPAGTYRIGADITSDSSSTESLVYFSNSQPSSPEDTSIPGSSIVATVGIPNGSERGIGFITLPETVYKVRFYSGGASSSAGHAATFDSIRMTLTGDKNGIEWSPPGGNADMYNRGEIHNCRISGFCGAGILLMDTGTPVERNVTISDCHIFLNNVGIYLRKDAEFNLVTNCGIKRNFYGVINRGGNNYFANCGVDGNRRGMIIENLEGTNWAHSGVANCSFHHNGQSNDDLSYGLLLRGVQSMFITGCTCGFSDVRLENAGRTRFVGCTFGRKDRIEVVNSEYINFIGCGFNIEIVKFEITSSNSILISGCTVMNPDFKLKGCSRSQIVGCKTGVEAVLTIEDGGFNLVSSCLFGKTTHPIVFVNNSLSKVINCYNHNTGQEIEPFVEA